VLHARSVEFGGPTWRSTKQGASGAIRLAILFEAGGKRKRERETERNRHLEMPRPNNADLLELQVA